MVDPQSSDPTPGSDEAETPPDGADRDAIGGDRRGGAQADDVTGGAAEQPWRPYFPYDEPYPEQAAAVEDVRETAEDGGFALFEGACGTGKTLVSLMAGVSLVRDPSTDYERVLCLTSVNQQLEQFEADVEAVNRHLRARRNDEGADPADGAPEPVRGLTLIGKGSVCSYTATGDIDPERESVQSRCEDLREPVRAVIEEAGDARRAVGRLQSMVEAAEAGAGAATTSSGAAGGADAARLSPEDGDWTAPYASGIPELPGRGEETAFCPFYAESRLASLTADADADPLALDLEGMVTPEAVRRRASERGRCPHVAMRATVEEAEVVLGNYYHAFDPVTVAVVTGALLDEGTFVVCDEAHALVERIRDLLSDSVSRRALATAAGEVRTQVVERAFDDGGRVRDTDEARAVATLLESMDLDRETLLAFARFLDDANDWLADRTAAGLAEEGVDWREGWHADLPAEVTAPLRDPAEPAPDDFGEWVEEAGHGALAERARSLGAQVAALLTDDRFPADRSGRGTSVDGVGRVLTRLWQEDNVQYLRTVSAERRADPAPDRDLEWERHYAARLRLHNCLPSREIAARLGEFGGGVLMSATLAPLSAFSREVGVAGLAERRPVRELVSGLSFPAENRASLALKTTPFTFENRGAYDPRDPPADPLFNRVRGEYGQVVATVARETPGNVLVGMPSYAEAKWAAHVLADAGVEKAVLVDESSSNAETEALKDEFFAGRPKVLVTSLRGTLTEGVDYDGDKLSACLVCGVPVRNVRGPLPRAILTAYEEEFGEDRGFELAFTLPAVRKARQALGRVIRGPEEVGVRVLADERYAKTGTWNSVGEFLPAHERAEFRSAGTMLYADHLRSFWDERAADGE